MISGVVLAAGRSRRMGGTPKALLELGGRSFLGLAITSLREGGCGEVWVVVGTAEDPHAPEVAAAAAALGARVLRNRRDAPQQIHSLQTALRALGPDVDAVVAAPVDVPRAGPAVVRSLIDMFRRRGAPVVLPTWGGTRGHPALFSRATFAELLSPALSEGARSVIRARDAEVAEVPVDEPGILVDIDTPDDLRRLREAAP